MFIVEILTDKCRESYRINNYINLDIRGIMGLEEMLFDSTRVIYEDQAAVIKYREFINSESIHTIPYNDLVIGNEYYPVQYRGAPYQQSIMLDLPSDNCKFISEDVNELTFSGGIEMTKTKTGVASIYTTLVFKDKTEADHHLMLLKLKFGEWYFKFRPV